MFAPESPTVGERTVESDAGTVVSTDSATAGIVESGGTVVSPDIERTAGLR